MCEIVFMVFNLVNVKTIRTIAQILVAFSEKLSFTCMFIYSRIVDNTNHK